MKQVYEQLKIDLKKYGTDFGIFYAKQVLISVLLVIIAMSILVSYMLSNAIIQESAIYILRSMMWYDNVNSTAFALQRFFSFMISISIIVAIIYAVWRTFIQVNLYNRLLNTNVVSGRFGIALKTVLVYAIVAIIIAYPLMTGTMGISAIAMLIPGGMLVVMLGAVLIGTVVVLSFQLLTSIVMTAFLTNKPIIEMTKRVSKTAYNKIAYLCFVALIVILIYALTPFTGHLYAYTSGGMFLFLILSIIKGAFVSVILNVAVYKVVEETVEAMNIESMSFKNEANESAQVVVDEAQEKADADQEAKDEAQEANESAQVVVDEAQEKADADQEAKDDAQEKVDADQVANDEAQEKADADQVAKDEEQEKTEEAKDEAQEKVDADQEANDEAQEKIEEKQSEKNEEKQSEKNEENEKVN